MDEKTDSYMRTLPSNMKYDSSKRSLKEANDYLNRQPIKLNRYIALY
jgi:hypothetical protein